MTDPRPTDLPAPLAWEPDPALLVSAKSVTPWARALHRGLRRHGPTPTYDTLVAIYGYDPAHPMLAES